jgi:hypothetical protein
LQCINIRFQSVVNLKIDKLDLTNYVKQEINLQILNLFQHHYQLMFLTINNQIAGFHIESKLCIQFKEIINLEIII